MSVKCGSCKGNHENVADVRNCYAGQRAQESVAQQADWTRKNYSADWHAERGLSRDPFATKAERRQASVDIRQLPTDNQIKYIKDLRSQKGLDPLAFSGTRQQASREIDRLKGLPAVDKPVQTRQGHPAVEDGRYAVEHDGVVKFYKIHNGYRKVFVEVYASDARYPVTSWESRKLILKAIAKDPQEAMLRFGREIGSCGHCGRTLTDEESRAYGVGPICRGKLGW